MVSLGGRDIYLGKWNTKASRAEYDRLIGEWLAGGRCLPAARSDLTVAELAAIAYASPRATTARTGSLRRSSLGAGPAVIGKHYGHTLAHDFGPLALQATQRMMRTAGHAPRNQLPGRSHPSHVPVGVARSCCRRPSYRRFGRARTAQRTRPARETVPVKPVADAVIDATLPTLPPVVADMVRLQRLTGCRPAEVCILRPCDVDRSGKVWGYRPRVTRTNTTAASA